jgi:DNA-binding GntR family transcriptional regulator
LPGRNELARSLSLSSDTVALAIAQLKTQGILTGVKGQRCRIPGSHSKDIAASPSQTISSLYAWDAWDAIACQISDDIAGGAFASGIVIPNCKELRNRYQTSQSTLRKALDVLCGVAY